MDEMTDKFDLTDDDDVFRLGHEMGKDVNKVLMPVLRSLPSNELRIVFLAAFMASSHGAMTAAVGVEAARAITDTMQNVGEDVAAQKKREAH